MSFPGIIFSDANTIWHRRLAEALGKLTPTIAFLPQSDLLLRCGPINRPEGGAAAMIPCGLPRGWASKLARPAQRLFARRIRVAANCVDDPVVLISSPALAPLSQSIPDLPSAYYGADDYGSYAGWPGALQKEKTILAQVDLGVFVSNSLKDRAVADLGLDAAHAFVSPNATEARFADRSAPQPEAISHLPRPIVGILGAMSDRLDLDFIATVADLDAVGTLLVVGPDVTGETRLQEHPKIHVTGRLPHDQMHIYARAMDIALIPYAQTVLNFHCSPMRLWDHLATGVPIFALDTCDQIVQLKHSRITVGNQNTLIADLTRFLGNRQGPHRVTGDEDDLFWAHRAQTLLSRLQDLPRLSQERKAS